VHYLGLVEPDSTAAAVYGKQCRAPGATFSFEIDGGEKECFAVLNALKVVKLAVSLGGTESLASHPASMTHADVEPEQQLQLGITPSLIRLSVGLEHPQDIIADLRQALSDHVPLSTSWSQRRMTEVI
jgi:methionine-gamma-lyase